MKIVVAWLVILSIILAPTLALSDQCLFEFRLNSFLVKVCGKGYKLDVGPSLVAGKLNLPFRFFAEKLGMTVAYNSFTKNVTAQGFRTEIDLTINSKKAFLNGKSVILTNHPVIIKGRTVIQIEAFDMLFSVKTSIEGKAINTSIESSRIKYPWLDFTLPVDQKSGNTMTLSNIMTDSNTKAVVIEFWYTACTHCREQLKHLQVLHSQYADKGLVVLGICTDGPENEASRWPMLEEIGVTFPTLLDEAGEIYTKWIQPTFPNFFLLKPFETFVLIRQEGASDEALNQLDIKVRELLGL